MKAQTELLLALLPDTGGYQHTYTKFVHFVVHAEKGILVAIKDPEHGCRYGTFVNREEALDNLIILETSNFSDKLETALTKFVVARPENTPITAEPQRSILNLVMSIAHSENWFILDKVKEVLDTADGDDYDRTAARCWIACAANRYIAMSNTLDYLQNAKSTIPTDSAKRLKTEILDCMTENAYRNGPCLESYLTGYIYPSIYNLICANLPKIKEALMNHPIEKKETKEA
jgi:hypothetical protein